MVESVIPNVRCFVDFVCTGPTDMRHTDNGQYTRLVHGRMGREVRCLMLACAVEAVRIRNQFPNPDGETTDTAV